MYFLYWEEQKKLAENLLAFYIGLFRLVLFCFFRNKNEHRADCYDDSC